MIIMQNTLMHEYNAKTAATSYKIDGEVQKEIRTVCK